MTFQHGTSKKYVARQMTLTVELDDALRTASQRTNLSVSAIVRATLLRDRSIARLLRLRSTDLMAVPLEEPPK